MENLRILEVTWAGSNFNFKVFLTKICLLGPILISIAQVIFTYRKRLSIQGGYTSENLTSCLAWLLWKHVIEDEHFSVSSKSNSLKAFLLKFFSSNMRRTLNFETMVQLFLLQFHQVTTESYPCFATFTQLILGSYL